MKTLAFAAFLLASSFANAAFDNVNRLAPRAPLLPCESEEIALAIANDDRCASDSRWVIDAGKWERNAAAGSFKVQFKRPWRWWFRRTVIRFTGVDGAFRLIVNGQDVGSAANDKLLAEFDISPNLNIFFPNDIEVRLEDGAGVDTLGEVLFVSEHCRAPKDFVVNTQVTADGKASFVLLDELGNTIKKRDVPEPKFWTTEKPFLYVTPVEFHHGWWIFGGTEYYGAYFYFRNDAHLDLCGALAEGGSLTPNETTRLKAHNVNAIKDVALPLAPGFLDACDREGIAFVTDLKFPGVHPCLVSTSIKGQWLTTLKDIRANNDAAKAATHKYQKLHFIGFKWQTGEVTAVSSNRVADFNDSDAFVTVWAGEQRLYRKALNIDDFPPRSERKLTIDLTDRGKGADKVRFEVVRDGATIAWEEFKK